jgi:hypothetical protein
MKSYWCKVRLHIPCRSPLDALITDDYSTREFTHHHIGIAGDIIILDVNDEFSSTNECSGLLSGSKEEGPLVGNGLRTTSDREGQLHQAKPMGSTKSPVRYLAIALPARISATLVCKGATAFRYLEWVSSLCSFLLNIIYMTMLQKVETFQTIISLLVSCIVRIHRRNLLCDLIIFGKM